MFERVRCKTCDHVHDLEERVRLGDGSEAVVCPECNENGFLPAGEEEIEADS